MNFKSDPDNGNETKSDTFPWDTFKSDTISFFIKSYSSISMTIKITFSQFCDYIEPKQWE